MQTTGSSSQAFDARKYTEVVRLCREGRALARQGESALALAAYLEAWDLLPEPKESWDASTYILAAVGDLLRATGQMSNALDLLFRSTGRTAGSVA